MWDGFLLNGGGGMQDAVRKRLKSMARERAEKKNQKMGGPALNA